MTRDNRVYPVVDVGEPIDGYAPLSHKWSSSTRITSFELHMIMNSNQEHKMHTKVTHLDLYYPQTHHKASYVCEIVWVEESSK
jgi:hypothetical protein